MATEVNKKHLNSRQFFFSANSLDFSALRLKDPKIEGETLGRKNLKKQILMFDASNEYPLKKQIGCEIGF